MEQDLAYLAKVIYEGNKEKGFWDKPREFGTIVALIHSELSEALEADREDSMDDKLPQFKGRHVELVDAMIRIFDCLGSENVAVDEIMAAKLMYNKMRPNKHGKAY